MSEEEREYILEALQEVYEYLRHTPPTVSGLDGWHNDMILAAKRVVRNA